jgi:hypothetical protein
VNESGSPEFDERYPHPHHSDTIFRIARSVPVSFTSVVEASWSGPLPAANGMNR